MGDHVDGKNGVFTWFAYGHLSCESEETPISTNICGEKLKNCGYQFKWSFEEALADWFEDNERQGLK